jgi:predicted ATPase with chaperone activity
MALAIAHSRGLDGLNAPPVIVETHLASGLPSFALVGLPDTEVKEARDRVRAAIVNSGFEFPSKRTCLSIQTARVNCGTLNCSLAYTASIVFTDQLINNGRVNIHHWVTHNLILIIVG